MTPRTAVCQSPLSMGFPRQEYWSDLSFSPPEDLPHPGTEPGSPALQADALLSEPPGKPNENPCLLNQLKTQIIISVPQNVVRMWMGS